MGTHIKKSEEDTVIEEMTKKFNSSPEAKDPAFWRKISNKRLIAILKRDAAIDRLEKEIIALQNDRNEYGFIQTHHDFYDLIAIEDLKVENELLANKLEETTTILKSKKEGSFNTEEFYKAALRKTYGKGGEK